MHIDNTALKTNNLAVLLIDMQPNFYHNIDEIVPYQIMVIRFCAKNNIPLFVITYDGWGKIVPALLDELKAVKHVSFIKKTDDNAFICTSLEKELQELGARSLFLMGIFLCACVLATAKGAVGIGYNIITAREVLGDSCPTPCTVEKSWVYSGLEDFTVVDNIELATQMSIPQEHELYYPWSYRIERLFDRISESIFCRLRPFFTGWI